MKRHPAPYLIVLFCFLVIYSCKTEDIDPDSLSNMIKVSCALSESNTASYLDSASSKEIWISTGINGCSDRQFNSFGHCWNFNTDILPTIKSEKYTVSWADAKKFPFRETNQGIPLFSFAPAISGIPVSGNETKLIVRGFVIFNDTLVRYSDPLVIVNPVNYAI